MTIIVPPNGIIARKALKLFMILCPKNCISLIFVLIANIKLIQKKKVIMLKIFFYF
jgi:hypothetical protein